MKTISLTFILGAFYFGCFSQESIHSHWMLYFNDLKAAQNMADSTYFDTALVCRVHAPFQALQVDHPIGITESNLRHLLPESICYDALPGMGSGDNLQFNAGNILVLTEGEGDYLRKKLLSGLGLQIVRSIKLGENTLFTIQLALGLNDYHSSICKMIEDFESVIYAESEIIGMGRGAYLPNDPLLYTQWYLNQVSDVDVDAPEAWEETTGSASVVISIIDGDGYDLDHPDLLNIVDPWDAVNGDADPTPDNEFEKHGMPCAGIAGAQGDNSYGVVGMAYGASVKLVRMGYNHNVDGSWFTSSGIIASAASHSEATPGCVVASCSWFINSWGDDNVTIITAFESLRANARGGLGALICVATLNSGSTNIPAPAHYTSTLGIGASSNTDQRAGFSNFGDELHCVAPGVNLNTIDLLDDVGYSNDEFTYFSGTSASCPLVAGVIGLIGAKCPSLTADEMESALMQSCEKVGAYTYSETMGHEYGSWNYEMGYGRINADLALDLACYVGSCTGDFDNNWNIDTSDLLIFLGGFGCNSDCASDLDGDDIVSVSDLLIFITLFGTPCL